jgi:hypothetical protein
VIEGKIHCAKYTNFIILLTHSLWGNVNSECQIYFQQGRYAAWLIKKKKVKLSLCLTKHNTMKAYRVSGGIAPCILDLGTRWT